MATATLDHPAAAHWKSSVNPWVIAVTVMLATFMEVLDTSIANVALPHIAGNLSAGVDESTWILTSYLVSNAIVLPLTGWFSTVFGRRNFFIVCIALFTLSSMACGFAPNLETLLICRVLQGIGGGALQPISQAILFESFPKSKQGVAMGVFGMGIICAPIIGPTLGGWITDNYSWRWIFLINIPFGLLAMFLTLINVEDPPYLVRKAFGSMRIDYIGLGLLSVGLAALQIMLDRGERLDWFESATINTLTVMAVVGIISAVIWEFRREDPIVNFRLLLNRTFLSSTILMFTVGAVLYGSIVLLPLMLQTLMGYTATSSGMVLSPGGFATLIMMPITGLVIARIDLRWVIALGMLIVAGSLFYMSTFNLEINFGYAVMARVYQAMGLALVFVPLNTAAFGSLRREDTNAAAGIINLARNIGGSVGIALCTALVSMRTQFHQVAMVGHFAPDNPIFMQRFNMAKQALISAHGDPIGAAQQAHALLYASLHRQAQIVAYVDIFRWMGIAFLCLIPLVFFLKHKRHGVGGAPVH